MSTWYYCRNGQQLGPLGLAELKGMIECGEVDDTALVWQRGMSEWVKVRKHPDLVSSLPVPAVNPSPATEKTALPRAKSLVQALLNVASHKVGK